MESLGADPLNLDQEPEDDDFRQHDTMPGINTPTVIVDTPAVTSGTRASLLIVLAIILAGSLFLVIAFLL